MLRMTVGTRKRKLDGGKGTHATNIVNTLSPPKGKTRVLMKRTKIEVL